MSYDYATPLSEEEYENEKVKIFAKRAGLVKKQDEIDAFQREVNFEKAQLEAHEKAIDEQFVASYEVTQINNIADHLNATYDFTGLPEGATVTLTLSVPNEDGSLNEHSVDFVNEEPQVEDQKVNDLHEASRALGEEAGKWVLEQLLGDTVKMEESPVSFLEPFLKRVEQLDEQASVPTPNEQDPTFEVKVSLEEAFPELRNEYNPNHEALENLSRFFGLPK